MRVKDFLAGRQILEEVQSPINGKLVVVRDLAWGTHIMAGGLTQSGGVAGEIWKTSLRKLRPWFSDPGQVLILGLGGGSIVGIVRRFWPRAEIVGVDIDPVIVNLGKKYLGLKKLGIEVKIQDALEYARGAKKKAKKYDLICVDLYVGDSFPQKFEEGKFLELIRKLLTKKGVVVFNRLYYGDKRPLAMKFLGKLQETFGRVEILFPQANIMFLCYNQGR